MTDKTGLLDEELSLSLAHDALALQLLGGRDVA
jgi:hypothetical protein